MQKQAIFNWSGGKDSAFALAEILKDKTFDISALLTSINQHYQRVSMHGVRWELIEKQAENIGIPLEPLWLPEAPSMENYNQIMAETLGKFTQKGVEYSIFGDIFLKDLKQYREQQLAKVGMKGVFPIWQKSTDWIIKEFINQGFKAVIICVNAQKLDKSFAGRIIDEDFIKDFPDTADICGENGEYHSFVFDAPYFKKPIDFEIGETILREYPAEDDSNFDSKFWYTDLILK